MNKILSILGLASGAAALWSNLSKNGSQVGILSGQAVSTSTDPLVVPFKANLTATMKQQRWAGIAAGAVALVLGFRAWKK